MRRIPPYIDCILHYYLMETYGQVACTARTPARSGEVQAARHLFYPLLGGGIAKRGGGLASTTPRFHPFLNAPTKLMETYGQIACTARTPAQSGSGGAQA